MEILVAIIPLLLIAFGGVGVIWLLLLWTGAGNGAEIEDVPQFRQLLRDAAPDFQPVEIMLAADRKSGIAAARNGRAIAVVTGLGDKLSAKILRPDDRASCRLVGGTGKKALALRVETPDVAWPAVEIALYAPPGLDLCLYRSDGNTAGGSDPVGQVYDPTDAARAVGETWAKRIEGLTNPDHVDPT